MTDVLVLAGGPDRERPVSIRSAAGVARALRDAGLTVHERTIDRPSAQELRGMPAGVVWPVLHGRYGEGGPLQDLLEAGGRPYVGSGPRAARLAMDKVASKSLASACGLSVAPTAVLDPADPVPPLPLPLVAKPVFEGSTIGLHVCRTTDQWEAARREAGEALARGVVYMAEPFIPGRELTLALVDRAGGRGLEAMPFVEIRPAGGLYDYQAKYERNDTRYTADPELPPGAADRLVPATLDLARRIGVRHIARADFILDGDARAWFLEINTMPGFTEHSLAPMAAAAAGLDMPALCASLVRAALAGPIQSGGGEP